jgi:hypothetical protein
MSKDKLRLSNTTFSFKKSFIAKNYFRKVVLSLRKREITLREFIETMTDFYYPLITEYNLIYLHKFNIRYTRKINRLNSFEEMIVCKYKLNLTKDSIIAKKIKANYEQYDWQMHGHSFLSKEWPDESDQYDSVLKMIIDKTQREIAFFDVVINSLQSKIELLNVKVDAFSILKKTIIQVAFGEIKQNQRNRFELIKVENFSPLKRNNITAQGFGLFCSILNQSQVNQILPGESKTSFCKRVSATYNIEIDCKKARQFIELFVEFKRSSEKHLREVVNSILPNLDTRVKEKLENYISQETISSDKKLYA